MSEEKINYYEILKDTQVLDYDRTHKVAIHMKSKDGKKWMIEKGKYVKSFGNNASVKTPSGKENILVLVNGNAVRMADVKLYIDEVDDCGCDGNPIALPVDIAKAMMKEQQYADVEFVKQESSFTMPQKSKFDKSAVIGFLLGAVVVGGIMWFRTKDKKKALIGAAAGAFLGMVIGYFIGKRGEKKISVVNNIAETEMSTNSSAPSQPSSNSQNLNAENQEYIQIGERYDFSLKMPIYAMNLKDGVMYVAKNQAGQKMLLKPKGSWSGNLVQIDNPQFFILDADTKKITKVQSKKPLPFIDLGNNLFMPLSTIEQSSIVTPEELKSYLDSEVALDEDIYVKGRYAGKRYYNLMYIHGSEDILRPGSTWNPITPINAQ